jgi:hypothetical protein
MMATTLWQRNRSLHSHKTDPEALALVALVFKSGALLSKDQYSFRVGGQGGWNSVSIIGRVLQVMQQAQRDPLAVTARCPTAPRLHSFVRLRRIYTGFGPRPKTSVGCFAFLNRLKQFRENIHS